MCKTFDASCVDDAPVHDATGKTVMLGVRLLDALEHEGVVADLAQLHDGVHERLGRRLLRVALAVLHQQDALVLHVPVDDALQRRHVALDDVLHLSPGNDDK